MVDIGWFLARVARPPRQKYNGLPKKIATSATAAPNILLAILCFAPNLRPVSPIVFPLKMPGLAINTPENPKSPSDSSGGSTEPVI